MGSAVPALGGALFPVVAAGTALGGGAQIYGALEAENAAKRARREAQMFFQAAMGQRPSTDRALQSQLQGELGNRLLAAPQQYTPTLVSKELENAFIAQLNQDAGRQQTDTINQLNELQARRGTFRSGIGAQQTAQALGDLNNNLLKAQTQARLGFNQQRAEEMARAFGLNLQSNLQSNSLLQSELGRQQGLQNSIYQSLLGLAGGAGQGAAAAQQQAGAALGGLGQSAGNLAQLAILSQYLNQGQR